MAEVNDRMMQDDDDDMMTEIEENQKAKTTQSTPVEEKKTHAEPDLEHLLNDLNYLLELQKEQISRLTENVEKLPEDIRKLENVCAQANMIYNEMPMKLQEQATALYKKNLKQAQANCNDFSRQMQAWLKKREEGRDKALIKAMRMPLYGVGILSLTQMILFIWLLWYMSK